MQKPSFLIKKFIASIEEISGDPRQVLYLSIRASAFCIILSLILSPNLWLQDHRLYIRPLAAWAGGFPDILDQLLYVVLFAGCGFLLFQPDRRRIGFLLVPVFVFMVLQDQLRWQFYLYLYFFNLLAAAWVPRDVEDRHLDALRYMTIGVYFWSGIYKMNPYFANTLFPHFVSAWFPYTHIARIAGYAVPFLEAGIAILLFLPPTRRMGQLFAVCMLFVVMASLGPFGLNQYNFVWPVNFYLDGLAVFLFMDKKRPLWRMQALKSPFVPHAALALFILLPALGINNTLGHPLTFKLFCCTYGEELVNADGKPVSLSIPDGVRFPLNITSYPVLPAAYLKGNEFCPYLHDADKVRLRVVDDPLPFWSSNVQQSVYDICAAKPHLLSREKIQ